MQYIYTTTNIAFYDENGVTLSIFIIEEGVFYDYFILFVTDYKQVFFMTFPKILS